MIGGRQASEGTHMTNQIPMVSYLRLGDAPVLVAQQCKGCGARYFDRRNGCAGCEVREFSEVELDRDGEVRAFTIVAHAAPGIPVPFVAAIVDCGGTTVRGNLVDVEPDPAVVSVGMKVQLTTYSLGTDDNGVEAVGFAFAPLN